MQAPSAREVAGESARRRGAKSTQACKSCRTRKTKCDGKQPCSACVEHRFSCAYQPSVQTAKQRHRRDHRPILYDDRPASASQLPPRPAGRAMPAQMSPATDVSNVHLQSPTDAASTDAVDGLDDGEGLRKVNVHTMGQEFYGASGILTFLSKLRSKARQARSTSSAGFQLTPGGESQEQEPSLVSYMHSPESCTADSAPGQRDAVAPLASTIAIEKECVRLYFQNLHYIHPVLDKADFWQRCEDKVWSVGGSDEGSRTVRDRTFGPLYDTVVALGGITAADDDHLFNFLIPRKDGLATTTDGSDKLSQSRILAAKYFLRAKSRLGDIFEICSFNGTLTLLLMSVYCQNALKPHSCYMYTGMAVRSAFAMGIPNTAGSEESAAGRLWWALYAVEIEMSMSAGRASALTEPSTYVVAMPPTMGSPPESFISYMVPFAALLNDICRKIYGANASMSLEQKSHECLDIDHRLWRWKSGLDKTWGANLSTLDESEWRTKQKLVCNLRFLNARILLHRPFLIYLTASPEHQVSSSHVSSCVEASQSTIRTLYDAFLVRPWFRTWWYNSTYVLYATMVVLYVLLSGADDFNEDALLKDSQRGLQILQAMKSNPVAARCAAVIQEILSITEAVLTQRQHARATSTIDNSLLTAESRTAHVSQPSNVSQASSPREGQGNFTTHHAWNDDFGLDTVNFEDQARLWDLVDPTFLDSLLDVQMVGQP